MQAQKLHLRSWRGGNPLALQVSLEKQTQGVWWRKLWKPRQLWKIAGRRVKPTLTTSGWRTWYSSSGPKAWVWADQLSGGRGLPAACWGSVHSLLVFSCLGVGGSLSCPFFLLFFAGPLKAGACRTASASRGTDSVCCALAAKKNLHLHTLTHTPSLFL